MRDSNLYTLLIRYHTPTPSSPPLLHLIDANDPRAEVRYYRKRDEVEEGKMSGGAGYVAALYDAYSEAKLASVVANGAKVKNRALRLHNPDEELLFESTGSLSFEWTFVFEERRFQWRRETWGSTDFTCTLNRSPDPSVEMCICKAPSKGKEGYVQLMDFNLERFEIKDAKGLEIAMYMSLISLIDATEDRLASRGEPKVSPQSTPALGPVEIDDANPNEIIVRKDGATAQYAARAVSLLEDPAVLFVVIKTRDADAAAKAVEVADATKRARHRIGLDQDGPGLYQYLLDEPAVEVMKNGPRVIKLDDAPKQATKWTPPPNISIYLSKIDLPDLNPSRRAAAKNQSQTLAAHVPPRPVKSMHDLSPPTSSLKVPQTGKERERRESEGARRKFSEGRTGLPPIITRPTGPPVNKPPAVLPKPGESGGGEKDKVQPFKPVDPAHELGRKLGKMFGRS